MKKSFQFKQFHIQQTPDVLSVGTDGILLGSWTSVPVAGRVLDVGTGTGLLCLMMAQRTPQSHIIGIDISPAAISCAKSNIAASHFQTHIQLMEADLKDFEATPFDLIVVNPPFFDTGPRNSHPQLAKARHTDVLTLPTLIASISHLLAAEGKSSLILPFDKLAPALSLAHAQGLFPTRITQVSATQQKPPHRVLIEFEQMPSSVEENHLIIQKGGANQYTDEYIRLTKDFYLFM
ncbi:MAG: methyltransferase [Bacteroidota bacterium]